jgi:hypothetical protein
MTLFFNFVGWLEEKGWHLAETRRNYKQPEGFGGSSAPPRSPRGKWLLDVLLFRFRRTENLVRYAIVICGLVFSTAWALEADSILNMPFASRQRSASGFVQRIVPDLQQGSLCYLRLSDPTKIHPLFITGDAWSGNLRFSIKKLSSEYSAECSGVANLFFDAPQGSADALSLGVTSAAEVLQKNQAIRVSITKLAIKEYLPMLSWRPFLEQVGVPGGKGATIPKPVGLDAKATLEIRSGTATLQVETPLHCEFIYGIAQKWNYRNAYWRLKGTCTFPLSGQALGLTGGPMEAQMVFFSDTWQPKGAAQGGDSLEEAAERGASSIDTSGTKEGVK